MVIFQSRLIFFHDVPFVLKDDIRTLGKIEIFSRVISSAKKLTCFIALLSKQVTHCTIIGVKDKLRGDQSRFQNASKCPSLR